MFTKTPRLLGDLGEVDSAGDPPSDPIGLHRIGILEYHEKTILSIPRRQKRGLCGKNWLCCVGWSV